MLKAKLDRTVSRIAEMKTISNFSRNAEQLKEALDSGQYTNHQMTRNTINDFN